MQALFKKNSCEQHRVGYAVQHSCHGNVFRGLRSEDHLCQFFQRLDSTVVVT